MLEGGVVADIDTGLWTREEADLDDVGHMEEGASALLETTAPSVGRGTNACPTDSSQSPALEGRGGCGAACGRQARHRRQKREVLGGDWPERGVDLA